MQTKSALTALAVSILMLVVSDEVTAASWYEEYDLTSFNAEVKILATPSSGFDTRPNRRASG